MHRIRVSILIVRDDQLLFVKESGGPRMAEIDIDPEGDGFWQLPGGGLEDGESIFEAAVREAGEETGLTVDPDRIVYVQEYVNPVEPLFQAEFIVLATVTGGRLTVSGEDEVIDLRFVNKASRKSIAPAPWHDREIIWLDALQGFPAFRHLGVDSVDAGGLRRLHTAPFPDPAARMC